MSDLKQLARDIFAGALADCSIEHSFDRLLQTEGHRLFLDGNDIVDLDRLKRVRILSIGKAAAPMLQALLSRLPLPPSCDLEGVLIAPGERP